MRLPTGLRKPLLGFRDGRSRHQAGACPKPSLPPRGGH
jgi:hypothetical protein